MIHLEARSNLSEKGWSKCGQRCGEMLGWRAAMFDVVDAY